MNLVAGFVAGLGFTVALAGASASSSTADPAVPVSARAEPEALSTVTHERGGFTYITGFSVLAPDDIWAATVGGFVHYDGASWRLAAIVERGLGIHDFETLDGAGWAVGDRCSAIRFDHGEWSLEKLPWDCELSSVSIAPSGEAWAVGSGVGGSVVLHHDGDAWERVEHPRSSWASAVFMLSDDAGWIASYDEEDDRPQLLRLADGAWERFPTPPRDAPIRCIHGTSATDIWAMGGDSSHMISRSGSHLWMHFDGEAWSVENDTASGHPGAVRDVRMLTDNSGWAVDDNNNVLRFDGRRWLVDRDLGFRHRGEYLQALAVLNSEQLWVGGSNFGPIFGDDGEYSPWDGDRGTTASYFGGADGLTSLSMTADGYGWAVGLLGPAVIREDGLWRAIVPSGLGVLQSDLMEEVLVLDDQDVWVGTAPYGQVPRMFHFDGATWAEHSMPTEHRIEGFSAIAHDDVWAVTSNRPEDSQKRGDIIHFDGTEWRLEHSVVGDWLLGLDMLPTGEGWAVGGNTALRFDSESWVAIEPGVVRESDYLRDVRFTSPDRGWLLGARSLLERADGRWLRHDLQLQLQYPQDYFRAVEVAPNGDVWALAKLSIWYRHSDDWRYFEVPSGMWMPFEQLDIEITPTEDGYSVFVSGRHDTIARIDVPDGGLPEPAHEPSEAYLPMALR